jgi:hypothetical protein
MKQREIRYDDSSDTPLHSRSTLELMPLLKLQLGAPSFGFLSSVSEEFVAVWYASYLSYTSELKACSGKPM